MKAKYKSLFYAVSSRGQGVVYTDRPVRAKNIGCWLGTIEGCYSSVVSDLEACGIITLPELKYSDEPIELKLKLEYG